MLAGRPETHAWRPSIAGIAEVFHARFVDHAYPAHTHAAWTLLIVDDGAIRYDLDRHHHGAVGRTVTLLPPHVPHDGRPATPAGFRKRVLYLDAAVLGDKLVGAAVDHPGLDDAVLWQRIHQLHLSLGHPGDGLEAESRLALLRIRLRQHLAPGTVASDFDDGSSPVLDHPAGNALAARFRDLLDAHVRPGLSLAAAGRELHAHPAHLVRSFSSAFGLPPHAYLTGRRIDLARRLLLGGQRPAEVASAAGFYDQAHLNRVFRRYLGTSPGRYTGDSRGRC
ncbi:helix-turn-helix transcriptional regulator [Phytoactinopolyspora alkaliphila]|uniref:helix-turn-helix transcriptional regulator n=1 Tax=Phytoactinopolyspora alkaliphila TaxID=1783498 RepID=UPI001C208487